MTSKKKFPNLDLPTLGSKTIDELSCPVSKTVKQPKKICYTIKYTLDIEDVFGSDNPIEFLRETGEVEVIDVDVIK